MAREANGTIRYGFARTRLGKVLVASTARGICSVQLAGGDAVAALRRWTATHAKGAQLVEDARAVRDGVEQIEEYSAGRLQRFQLPLDLSGTAFQLSVWAALQKIPYGETRTYAQVARVIGAPKSTRAVGAANGKNPVPIVIPCHRVVAKKGLGGFTGGLHQKEALLALEGVLLLA